MSESAPNDLAAWVAQQLPAEQAGAADALSPETAERFAASWRELSQQGFRIQVGKDAVAVRQEGNGFECVIQLSRPEDLGELRRLFAALRAHFGRRRDRLLPWLFLPGDAVTAPYEHLRTIVTVCQYLRQMPSREP